MCNSSSRRVRIFRSERAMRSGMTTQRLFLLLVSFVASVGMLAVACSKGEEEISSDGGPATSASLEEPVRVAVDASGTLFISDWGNHRIRRVDATSGIITTVAGTGRPGFSGDEGPAISASLNQPHGVAVDASGSLFIADAHNERVRRVDATSGIITTVAGIAPIPNVHGVAVDAGGNLFIVDITGSRILRVDEATGEVTTVAGNGTHTGLNHPHDVAVDASGNLFIADTDNHRVRRVGAETGVITTVAGDGTPGFSGDGGPATSARLRANPTTLNDF